MTGSWVHDVRENGEKYLSRWWAAWFPGTPGLENGKNFRSYFTLEFNMASFNEIFGHAVVSEIKPADLENYQGKRKEEGYSDSYVDSQLGKWCERGGSNS